MLSNTLIKNFNLEINNKNKNDLSNIANKLINIFLSMDLIDSN